MAKHLLNFVAKKGLLADALGIDRDDPQSIEIEGIVEYAINNNRNTRQLFERIGELDISDELWANFLYTYGWWDGRRRQ